VGLTMARLRAIEESASELLLFVDDDNVVAPDYAEVLLCLAAEFPKLGCFGAGRLEPEFEVAAAPGLEPYLPMLGPPHRWRISMVELSDGRDHAVGCGTRRAAVRRGCFSQRRL